MKSYKRLRSMSLAAVTQTVEQSVVFPIFLSIFGFIAIWLIVGILICVWVYGDAESRGMNGALWLIIILLGNVIGLIVYLIVRGEKGRELPQPAPVLGQRRYCQYCGQQISASAKFCAHCGKAIGEQSSPSS